MKNSRDPCLSMDLLGVLTEITRFRLSKKPKRGEKGIKNKCKFKKEDFTKVVCCKFSTKIYAVVCERFSFKNKGNEWKNCVNRKGVIQGTANFAACSQNGIFERWRTKKRKSRSSLVKNFGLASTLCGREDRLGFLKPHLSHCREFNLNAAVQVPHQALIRSGGSDQHRPGRAGSQCRPFRCRPCRGIQRRSRHLRRAWCAC